MTMRFTTKAIALALTVAASTPVWAQSSDPFQDPNFATSYEALSEVIALVDARNYDAAFEMVAPIAEAGDPVAQNLLGEIFRDRPQDADNRAPALKMFLRAAAQEYGKGYFNAAQLWLDAAPGVRYDPVAAMSAFEAGAALGYQPAHEELVWHLFNGVDEVYDAAKGIAFAKSGVEAFPNSAPLLVQLGDSYYYGLGQPEDHAASLPLYERAARLGDMYAQYRAGFQYYNGLGTELNDTNARLLFEQAAAQEDGKSYGMLAQIHYRGYGVPVDHDRAIAYAMKGDDLGSSRAAFYLGESYRYGRGSEVEPDLARSAYTRAHDRGWTYGLMRLGDMAYFGEGEPQDFAKSFRIFEQVLAEDPDEEDAAYSIGYMLMRGEGTDVDLAAATRYIEAAVSMGHGDAMGEAIQLYGRDDRFQGPQSDVVRALAHCVHATLDGWMDELNPDSVVLRVCADVGRIATDAQRSEAKVLAGTL